MRDEARLRSRASSDANELLAVLRSWISGPCPAFALT